MHDAEILVQVLILGLANGALFALIALGYTLVYGIIELINFAHGDVYMIGTFTALTVVLEAGVTRGSPAEVLALTLVVALVIAIIVCALLNMTIERLAYRPLRNAPRLAPLISAIGVSFILMNVGLHWYGASQVRFPDLLPSVDLLRDVLGLQTAVHFTTKDLAVLLLTVPLLVGLNIFVSNTRLGKAMRATAQDREAAALMGININQTIALTFLLGGALAGAAGFLSGLYNNSAWFQQGFRGGLMAFTAAVLGGIGNLTGAVLGGVIIGVISALSDFYFDPRWTQAVVFGILILIMVFRPSGLLGEQVPEKV
ncbi:MAG TPA: branched-chain amino acid ABC transporter permease [Chloroflexota bacterium]|nr:branched-chain amino acid ABC transporter permease [Chloroflexota bacterium]